MKTTLNRIGAFVCVAAFLIGLVNASGPRSPGPDVNLTSNDIVLLVNSQSATQAYVGDNVTVNVTIHNSAQADTDSMQVLVAITLETGKVIYYDNLTNPIPPGGQEYLLTYWDTTNDAVGDHTINVTVTEQISGDDDDSNNVAFKPFTLLAVPRPHVIIDSLSLPDNALVGDPVTIIAVVKNNGTADMTDTDSVKFYLGSQPLVNGIVQYATPLPVGLTTTVTYTWDTSSSQAGPFFVRVEVQSSKAILESHIINLSFPQPNVYISSLSVDKLNITQGDSIHITAKFKNNGTKNATDEEVWFLVDQATSPTLTNYTQTRTITKGGVEITIPFDWNSTDAAPGYHNFTVRVPGSSDPKAIATTANVMVNGRSPLTSLLSFDASPGTVKSGEMITLSALLTNTGSADAYNQEVRFYLGSTDTYPLAIKKVNVKVGGTSWANATFYPEIGENDTLMNFIVVFVNPPNDMSMNDTVKVLTTVPLRPDLIVQGVDATRIMTVDGQYVITATIANIGKAPALNFTVKFNLGTELPYLVKGLDLANGQTMAVCWTVQPSIVGQGLRLKVEVNAEHSPTAVESDEFNNIFEGINDITVMPQPKADIVLQGVQPNHKSFTVKTGEKATPKLTVTLKNSGQKDGSVMLTIKEGLVVFLSANVTVPANSTQTFIYKWNVTSAGTHTAKVEISGADAGLITSQITSVDMTEQQPGFELVVLVAAIAVVAILARKKRT
jgi:hypothetical protein